MDAIAEAAKFGIQEDRAVTYECDSVGTELNYRALNNVITNGRKSDLQSPNSPTFPSYPTLEKSPISLYNRHK